MCKLMLSINGDWHLAWCNYLCVFLHSFRLNTFCPFFTDILVGLHLLIIVLGLFKTTAYFLFDDGTPSTWHCIRRIASLVIAVPWLVILYKLLFLLPGFDFWKISVSLGLFHLVELFRKYVFWKLVKVCLHLRWGKFLWGQLIQGFLAELLIYGIWLKSF
jgi:hypothetical protein